LGFLSFFVSVSTGARHVVVENAGDGRFIPPRHLVYAVADRLVAVAFDSKTYRTSGEPVEMLQGVRPVAEVPVTGVIGLSFEVARDGSLTYVPRPAGRRRLVWVDREGNEEPIAAPERQYTYVQISPDGSHLALDIRDADNDIWIWDTARQVLQRLTFDKGLNRGVAWSPDGRRLAFSRAQDDGTEEIYWQPSDGSGGPEPLTKNSGRPMQPSAFSPDGKTLVYEPGASPRGVFRVAVGAGAAKGEALIAGAVDVFASDISQDGRWIAYHSAESGRPEVYVRPFPMVDSARWQVSNAGGTRPRWSRDGRELFYFTPADHQRAAALWAVPISPGPTFAAGRPVKLFEGNYGAFNQGRQTYDVSPDGKRFVMIQPVETPTPIIVVQNWTDELKRLVPDPISHGPLARTISFWR
jgi:hypothetical protein